MLLRSVLLLPLLPLTTTAVELDQVAAAQYSAVPSAPKPLAPVKPEHGVAASLPHLAVNNLDAGNRAEAACLNIQAKGLASDLERAAEIRQTFLDGWAAYKKYAMGFDELQPLSAKGTNDRYGWGLTIVDSLDTAIIMDLSFVVSDMLDFISEIDFTQTADGEEKVNMFETNIRYLGGLISGYDLLKSKQFAIPFKQEQLDMLLKQATILADKLTFGFNTKTGLPASDLDFSTNTYISSTYTDSNTNITYNSTNTASIGTFILEFARLSDLTGNITYRQLAEKADSYLIKPNPDPVYPALIGTQFDIDTGKMLTFDGGWQAGVDSFLEYLIKYYHYQSTNVSEQYRDFWLEATQSTVGNLAVHPYGFPDLTFISILSSNGSLEYIADDFSCFAGGNWLLGGALLGSPDIEALGVAWTDGCHHTYNTTLTGLGPLAFAWYDEQNNEAFDPADNNDAAARKSAQRRGYWIPQGTENWFSRPEPLESIFYAHRITGDPRWAEYAWDVYQAINTTARNPIAFAAVNNVDMPDGGSMSDNLDSFFFAEVLKYLYLTFSDASVIDLGQWVFNTEAHPFAIPCGKSGDVAASKRHL